MNRLHWQQLAEQRLGDAKILLDAYAGPPLTSWPDMPSNVASRPVF